MPKLSIIVPVYNVEAYLQRCIDSILIQEFRDFELILVDDGSSDQCGRIIDKYAERDNRIIPIHQKNKGVSAARNAGLRIAKGTYIGFVDSDDWIDSKMYSVLVNSLELNDCDIASCLFNEVDAQGNKINCKSNLSTQIMGREEFMKHLFDMPPSIYGAVWLKLFKKNVIRAGFSENYTHCEDNLFVAQCISQSDRNIFINDCLYNYYMRENSAGRIEEGITALGLPARRRIIEIAEAVSSECKELAETHYLDQCVAFGIKTNECKQVYRDLARNEYLSYMRDNPFCLIKNRTISIKQKVFYFIQFFKLLLG